MLIEERRNFTAESLNLGTENIAELVRGPDEQITSKRAQKLRTQHPEV